MGNQVIKCLIFALMIIFAIILQMFLNYILNFKYEAAVSWGVALMTGGGVLYMWDLDVLSKLQKLK